MPHSLLTARCKETCSADDRTEYRVLIVQQHSHSACTTALHGRKLSKKRLTVQVPQKPGPF